LITVAPSFAARLVAASTSSTWTNGTHPAVTPSSAPRPANGADPAARQVRRTALAAHGHHAQSRVFAEDIGGGVRGRHIDVYVPSVPMAKTFGVKRSTVSVIALPEDDG